MPDAPPNPELLRSLRRLARGLSALFWGLPVALILCVATGRADLLKPLGLVPVAVALALLFYGLGQMAHFQPQERPWRNALDRARLLALVNLGLSPFLYLQNRLPGQLFFQFSVGLLALSGLVFLFNLNLVLLRLGAMLPDETLRQETRQFTALNRVLLAVLLIVVTLYFGLRAIPGVAGKLIFIVVWLERTSLISLILLVLLPLAMTMALLWKTKEVILESVFGAGR